MAWAQSEASLEDWLALARARSPALAAARAAIREAAGVERAADSRRGPRVGADALYLRFQDAPGVALGPAGSYAPIDDNGWLAGLTLTQPLYTGGRISAAARSAEWSRRSAESWAADVEVEVTAAVAHVYDDALLARELLAVARQSEATLEEAVRVAREQYEAGAVARLDVLRAETRLSLARAAARESEVALANALERLAVLAGVPPDSAPPPAGSLEYAGLRVSLDTLLALARGNRHDAAALRAAATASRARASAARATRLPAVSLYAMTLATRPELVSGRDRWGWELLGGVSLSWPFLDFGEASGRAAASEAAAEVAEARAAGAIDAAVAEVRGQIRELERRGEDVRAGRANVERAERALEIAKERYLEGVGIQLEVLEAEADLTQVRGDLLRAIHGYRGTLIELRRAVGLPADARLPGVGEEGRR